VRNAGYGERKPESEEADRPFADFDGILFLARFTRDASVVLVVLSMTADAPPDGS